MDADAPGEGHEVFELEATTLCSSRSPLASIDALRTVAERMDAFVAALEAK